MVIAATATALPNRLKGRFRFYRELLSTSMGLSSEQVISDASLNRACKIAMKDYLRTELKEDSFLGR